MIPNLTGKSKVLFFGAILLAIISVSGCIGGGDGDALFVSGGDALEVDLIPEITTADSLEPFLITIRAENFGDFEATNVKVRLHGYDGLTYAEQGSLSDFIPLSPSTLAAPNYELDLPGDVGDTSWDVAAPYMSAELPEQEITLTAEVFYDYKSIASQQVVAATRDHIEELETRGEAVPVTPETSALNGPIAVDIVAPYPYVKVLEDETEFRIKVTLTNDGSGNAYNEDRGYDYLNKLTLKVPNGMAVDPSQCDFKGEAGEDLGYEGVKVLVIDGDHNPSKLRLIEGATIRELSCRLKLDRESVGGYNTYHVDVSAYYTYLQSVTRKLLITGTEEAPLQMQIMEPTRTKPDDWETNSNYEITVDVQYMNQPVKTGLTKTSFNAWVEGTEATVISTQYDADTELWSVWLQCPKMGSEQKYDLKLDLSYKGSVDTSIQRDAINYKT